MPPCLCRSVNDFDLRAIMYHGNMSIVYHAVDKRSGITVALKLYKRYKLSAIERHQVSRACCWVPNALHHRNKQARVEQRDALQAEFIQQHLVKVSMCSKHARYLVRRISRQADPHAPCTVPVAVSPPGIYQGQGLSLALGLRCLSCLMSGARIMPL